MGGKVLPLPPGAEADWAGRGEGAGRAPAASPGSGTASRTQSPAGRWAAATATSWLT